ncbi:regulator of G-protein signaling 9-binding protein [Elysia marginata]|uniref:Regulator of G-protein signaling 9-binding protein n=1 Tax=Elysia marginata TaxID=1093978 RepID=A0AAV4HM63_9GAST|nr:regulator of G-protein signaling 9-binding protein [Elysia marginata]
MTELYLTDHLAAFIGASTQQGTGRGEAAQTQSWTCYRIYWECAKRITATTITTTISACVGGGDHHDNGYTTASTSACHVSTAPHVTGTAAAAVGRPGNDHSAPATEGPDANNAAELLDFQAELEKGPPTKQECTKMVYSLSREVAVYCWLSMGVGAVSDSYSLRDELKASGQKLFDLVLLCKRRLVPLLLSKRLKEEEREDLERLYRIFAGCLETLQAEFIRAITLQSVFPLWDPNAHLIQTGATESVCLKKCSPLDPLDASALNRQIAENEEFQNVETSEMEPEEPAVAPSNNVHVCMPLACLRNPTVYYVSGRSVWTLYLWLDGLTVSQHASSFPAENVFY